MSRKEIRVDGLAEPISHFTDGVLAGGFLYVSGIVAVDRDGRLVGGDDVVAQTRQIFDNMRAVLEAGGCGFEDVVKVTVFLTDIDDRPLINPGAPGGVRRDAAGARRSSRCARLAVRGREGRGRRRRRRRAMKARSIRRVHHAGSTARRGRRPGPLAGRTLARQGPVRHRRDPHDVRLRASIADHVPERNAVGGAAPAGRRCGHGRQGASAGVRVERAGAERVVRDLPQPGAARARRPAGRRVRLRRRPSPPGSASWRWGRTRAARSAGLPAAACEVVGLKSQWGLISADGAFPLVPHARHGRPDGAQRRRRRAHVVGADRDDRSRSRA